MNGNGAAHKSAKAEPKENIFLFWPNIIGQPILQTYEPYSNNIQDIFESFLRSRRCITCLCIPGHAPSSTASPVFSMPSTDTPRVTLNNQPNLVLC
jgi:hypothetical protein